LRLWALRPQLKRDPLGGLSRFRRRGRLSRPSVF